MAIFLRGAAIFVGLANLYVLGGARILMDVESWWKSLLALLSALLLAALPGLLSSEILFRLARPALEGRFLYRYTVIVLGVCLGGMLCGSLVGFLTGAFLSGTPDIYDIVPNVVERLFIGLVASFFGALFGGALGLTEGLILGLPLAAILGLFRNRARRSMYSETPTP